MIVDQFDEMLEPVQRGADAPSLVMGIALPLVNDPAAAPPFAALALSPRVQVWVTTPGAISSTRWPNTAGAGRAPSSRMRGMSFHGSVTMVGRSR